MGLQGSTTVSNSADDVPHFWLRHPLSRVVSSESSSSEKLFSQALLGVLHGDVSLVVFRAPGIIGDAVGGQEVSQVLVLDATSDIHVLVVVLVVALSHRPFLLDDGVLWSLLGALSGPKLSTAESVVFDISSVAISVHSLGEAGSQFGLAVAH